MHFTRLRLHGFKSFVDQTELVIERGITGVVGPNGCGKSNVIESLRWVMGETSAKRMRGAEMDDVIFAGSSNRAARNVAEVTIVLDNRDRRAPPAFNDSEMIEITRRIERGSGSSYRINGREVRARDVQLLFADLASGANSTAIVSQGRVGAIIGAKPTERRVLLEEAAGIRGLHSRRHEAELRLKAAENNLERLEDVIGALETQNQALQRQAKQANRYRRLSDHIRRNEAILLHLRWEDAIAAVKQARARLKEAEEVVAERTRHAATASTTQAEGMSLLPILRKREAEAAAELQRMMLARKEVETEQERVRDAQAEVERRLLQLEADLEREAQLAHDASEALARLQAEKDELTLAVSSHGEEEAALQSAVEAQIAKVQTKEGELQEKTEKVASLEAQKNGLERSIAEAESRIARLNDRIAKAEAERSQLEQEISSIGDIGAAEAEIAKAEALLETIRANLETAETVRTEAARKTEEAQSAFEATRTAATSQIREAESALSSLNAEEKALARLVERDESDLFAPVIDAVSVDTGFETALGAAMGEELDAPTDTTAPVHWQTLSGLEDGHPLPEGLSPLANHVKAPAALTRRLSQIGIAASVEDAERLQSALKPGQRIVTAEGGLWRWDGYTAKPDAQTAAAKRLEQRNRLAEVRDEIAEAEKQLADIRTGAEELVEKSSGLLQQVRMEEAAAIEKLKDIRTRQEEAFAAVNAARNEHARLVNLSANATGRMTSLDEAIKTAGDEIAEVEKGLTAAKEALDVLPDPVKLREEVNLLRALASEQRAILIEKRSILEGLKRTMKGRQDRLLSIATEEASWKSRLEGADKRKADVGERREQALSERETLEARPPLLEKQKAELSDAVAAAEQKRKEAAEALAEGERAQAEIDRALKDVEAALAEARETRVRREAEVETAEQASLSIAERIEEKLECQPHLALKAVGIEEGEELPSQRETEERLERLIRERDNMGAVNLRAEQEAAELETQISSMHMERDDLVAAIAKLRQGINALNREGRERLLAAFEEVNSHFQELFTRLFGGGQAHLELTEAEDPLQSGLEIMASPPGKKLQIMSLLSGGEQALTALALLFAVFMTNPAPICVLDEVDAPLDDANVDRVCSLIEEMATSGKTRFIVVTHHRMTMARVDRLFGVTMSERGVSQLVSVDLRQAERIRETA